MGWDDNLPQGLREEILQLFIELYKLENLEFPRSLWPDEAVVGLPWLVSFSDGSNLGFSSVVYIRWELEQGGYWTRIVLSKGKIGPKSRITIPRMELNGAVMNKRLAEVMETAVNKKFGKVIHLVDSSTVLCYLHKEDQKLKPYEGIHVAEIQAAGKFENGLLQNWAWVEGKNNPADWVTKPRSVKELSSDGFWQRGPEFLRTPFEDWPIKTNFKG